MDTKIREAIKRLEELPPSKWTPATVLSVKQWLFPRMIAYLDGYRGEKEEVKTIYKNPDEEMYKEVFDKKEGETDSA